VLLSFFFWSLLILHEHNISIPKQQNNRLIYILYTLESRINIKESKIMHFFSYRIQYPTVCWMNEIIRLSEN